MYNCILKHKTINGIEIAETMIDEIEVIIRPGAARLTITPERTTFKFSSWDEMKKYFYFFKGVVHQFKQENKIEKGWRMQYQMTNIGYINSIEDMINIGYVTFESKKETKKIFIDNSPEAIIKKLSNKKLSNYALYEYENMDRTEYGMDLFGLDVDSVDIDYESSGEESYQWHDTTVLEVTFKNNKNDIKSIIFKNNNNGGSGSQVEISYGNKECVIDLITNSIDYYSQED